MLPISGDHLGVGPVGLLMEVEQNLLKKKCDAPEYHINIPVVMDFFPKDKVQTGPRGCRILTSNKALHLLGSMMDGY